MALDMAVARAVMAARQIERAVHDPGPWSINLGGISYPAVRWVGEDRVIFRAHVPDTCWLVDEPIAIDLVCWTAEGSDVVGSRMVEMTDGASSIEWVFALPEREPAQA